MIRVRVRVGGDVENLSRIKVRDRIKKNEFKHKKSCRRKTPAAS